MNAGILGTVAFNSSPLRVRSLDAEGDYAGPSTFVTSEAELMWSAPRDQGRP
jgi:hypothetical protein